MKPSCKQAIKTSPRWLFLGTFNTAVIILFILSILHYFMTRLPQRSFNREIWQASRAHITTGPLNPTLRQQMVEDLVSNHLPGMAMKEIETLLGPSVEMEQYHYFEQFEPDLVYELGLERTFIWDHRGIDFSPSTEYLVIRVDPTQKFKSWYIIGSTRWKEIVNSNAANSYQSCLDDENQN